MPAVSPIVLYFYTVTLLMHRVLCLLLSTSHMNMSCFTVSQTFFCFWFFFGVAQTRVSLPGMCTTAVLGARVAPVMADTYC